MWPRPSYLSLAPSVASLPSVQFTAGGSVTMSSRLAEFIVVAIVMVWLLTVVAAVIDPERSELAVTLAPIMGTIAGGAIAVLTIARKKNGGNQ